MNAVSREERQIFRIVYEYSQTDARDEAHQRNAAVKQLIQGKDFEWKNDFIIEEDE